VPVTKLTVGVVGDRTSVVPPPIVFP